MQIINRLIEFCSLQAPKDGKRKSRKAGFTIVELMVVIIIINLLSGVAIPKLTDYIERSREKIDLVKFFYLRDALNRALYEDDALRMDETKSCGNTKNNKDKLSQWLASEKGVTLFIIELHDILPANYQGSNTSRIKGDQNMCGLLTGESFWNQALKDAGFGAVADILVAREKNKFNSSGSYTAYQVKINNQNWWRTFPTRPLFFSKAMNGDINAKAGPGGQNRLNFKIRWTNGNPDSHSLEVFLENAQGSGGPYRTRLGTCFSTQPCK